jgi:hypothetical protein
MYFDDDSAQWFIKAQFVDSSMHESEFYDIAYDCVVDTDGKINKVYETWAKEHPKWARNFRGKQPP